MATVKGNIILNALNTVTSIIFPIITFPYAARVLLPEGIGAVNFLGSIINYIILLTSLGIPMYAVKEVAKYQDDKRQRDKITVEIIILSTILCLLGYIAVWLIGEFVPQVHNQASLFYVLSLSIVFSTIGVNWFYQGIENFIFITIRALIIRTLSAIALFVFVKDSSDLLIYGFINVGSTVGNNIINFIHLRKYIDIQSIKLNELKILRHVKPSIQVFILNLITSLYIQLNSIMLGFMSGDEEVGYFSAGTKISHIGLTMISSLGTVLLPHCSHLLKKGDDEGFKAVILKSLNATLALSWPMTIGLIVLAVPVTLIFCGKEFMESIPVLCLNAPVIILISLTVLMGIQILYPKDKINIVIFSASGGAIINLIFNILLIPTYGAIGAAISTLIAEFIVFIIQIIAGRKYYPFGMKDILNLKYILSSIVMGLIVFLSIAPIQSNTLQLLVGVLVGVAVYYIIMLFTKDQIAMEINQFVLSKFRHAK